MAKTDDDRPARIPVTLRDAGDPATYGHKAAGLATLLGEGYLVPAGCVFPGGTPPSPDRVRDALARLGPGPWAVRSSGVSEDLDDASFAGQYDTVLGVGSPEDVVDGIGRVQRSGRSGHVEAYRASVAHDAAPIAVIVQQMVDADAAGVAFSHNPLTGDAEVVIEAVAGLGDRLVDGTASPDRWVVRPGEVRGVIDTGVLDPATAQRLGAIVTRVAGARGRPQDVEWAISAGEVFLLQARPITHLPVPPTIEVPAGRWMKDTGHFPGPLTPIGASIMLPIYEAAAGEAICEEFGMPLQTVRQRSFGGEVYTQEVDLDGKHRTGAAPPWWVLAVACRVVPTMRRRLADAAAAVTKLDDYPRLWDERWRDECLERIEQARRVDLGPLTDLELLAELRRVVDEVALAHMKIHFRLTVPHCVGVYELFAVCRDELGWDLPRVLDLLGGLSRTTTAPAREMHEIVRALPAGVLDEGLAAIRRTAAGPALDAWLERWGLRTIDTDPGSPTIAERDDLILGLIAAECSVDQVAQRRQDAIGAARASITDAAGRDRFDRALAYAQIVYPQREDNVPYTEGLPAGLVRRVLVEIGERLVAAGTLQRRDDVSYLEIDELAPALAGSISGETPRQRVRRRRAETAWILAHPGPAIHGPAPVPSPDLRGIPGKARRILEASLWALAEELTPPSAAGGAADAITGIGASPGRYTGRVRMVTTEADLARVRHGDVLVCPTTHSSWAIVFGRIGALVTDGGGILAHPAIIAREFDVPAVLATGCATQRLEEGQIVTVDGSAGRVSIESPEPGRPGPAVELAGVDEQAARS